MERAGGEVLSIDAAATRLLPLGARPARSRRWAASDLVLFMEDDYLLRPDALQELLDAARRSTTVDYFAIYVDPSGVDERRPVRVAGSGTVPPQAGAGTPSRARPAPSPCA
jgi:GT2 family glycosyltransferase